MELVAAAIKMDTRSKTQLVDTMKGSTQLENPNAIHYLKAWLSDNGWQTDTLGKKTVAELLKSASPKLSQVLILRQQLAKSFVRKYQAMEKTVCADGRVRIIAWFAGEKWRQDIYCASASQLFKVSVEKHGINDHLHQKGKIAELTLGYRGSVGSLKAMGALDMGLTEEELHQLVDAWKQSTPKIGTHKFGGQCITYEGIGRTKK